MRTSFGVARLGTIILCIVLNCFVMILAALAQSAPKTSAPAKSIDYADESFVIEQLNDDVVFAQDGTGQHDQLARIRILSEAGVQRFGVLSFSYRNERERLDVVQVRVTKPDGSAVETPESSVQDLAAEVTRQAPTYSDLREKQIPVKALGIGAVLEWKIRTVRLKPDAAGQFWFAHDFVKDAIVFDQSLRITVPTGKYVKISSPGLQPEVQEEGGRKTYVWKTSQLSRPKEESKKKIQATVRPKPAVQLTTFRSWEELGRWYRDLERPQVEVTPAIQAKAMELTRGLTTNNEKERALYQFVSTKFRYISVDFGDGWYQPHAASDVLANQYGDCKDKHTLLATLLKTVGIEAWPALVGAGRNVDPEVPSPAQFNHVITYIPEGNSGRWLDSTPEVAPFGLLQAGVREQHVLVIPPNGAGVIKDTPSALPFSDDESFSAKAKLDSEGTLTGHFEITARGDGEVLLRSVFHASAPKDWQKLAQALSANLGFGGTVSELDISNPTDTATPFHISYSYERKTYSDWENRRITPPLPPITLPYSGEEDGPTEGVDIGQPGTMRYTATIELPERYAAEVPPDVKVDSVFATYTSSYKLERGVLSAERALTLKKPKLAPGDWEDYKKLLKAAVADETQFTELVRSDAPRETSARRNNPEAADFVQKAGQAIQRRDLNAAREALDQAERLNPEQKALWSVRSYLFGIQGQFDQAIRAAQKELELRPGDQPTYEYLAALQRQAGRNDDEIETRKKLVKLAPENVTATLELASALGQKKEYREAIPPLETALKATPDDSRLQGALLEALLRDGRRDDGLKMLARMREHTLDANQLNSVAWTLADTNTESALAKELAEKAILEYETQSKDITLSNVGSDHFRLVGALGATWDTLGWAYFRNGDVSKAERYIEAAWLLLQHAAAADHLGQIYERQGKKMEAIHAYQLSLAVNRNQPETRQRLEALGGDEQVRPTLRRGPPVGPAHLSPEEELSQLRTVPVPALALQKGSADYFVLFSSSGPQNVLFIRGDEELRGAGNALLKASYHMPFPDNGPERIIRRGILSCSQYTTPRCTFVLLLPANTTN